MSYTYIFLFSNILWPWYHKPVFSITPDKLLNWLFRRTGMGRICTCLESSFVFQEQFMCGEVIDALPASETKLEVAQRWRLAGSESKAQSRLLLCNEPLRWSRISEPLYKEISVSSHGHETLVTAAFCTWTISFYQRYKHIYFSNIITPPCLNVLKFVTCWMVVRLQGAL